jgi:hypothetical protein
LAFGGKRGITIEVIPDEELSVHKLVAKK